MTEDDTIVTQCPSCAAKFRVVVQYAGRRAKCPKCQASFKVQAAKPDGNTPAIEESTDHEPAGHQAAGAAGESSPKRVATNQVQYIGVNCRLCGTRMYGTPAQVGKPLTCPDCETQTTLPPPAVPQEPVVPAAMSGEQYELWEGENQPWGSALAADQPDAVAVHCELCSTLQYVEPDLVGTSVVCPDCGHATLVRPPAEDVPSLHRDDPGGELDVLPPDDVAATATSVASRLSDFESKTQEDQEKEMRLVATDRRARPRMPRWPLLTGWGAFLAAPGVVSRWISLSLLVAAFIALAVFAFSMLFSGFGAVAGLPLLCGAAGLCGLWYGAASACAVTVLTESSEGNNEIMAWPSTNPTDWFGEALYLLVAASASAAPGYLAVQLTSGDTMVTALAMLVSAWLVFPVMHLSTLEASSPFSLFMPGVLGSLRLWPGTWGLFYLLSAIGFVAVGGLVMLFASLGKIGLLLLGAFAVVGGLGAYFRLLGRLAWRIRHDSPAAVSPERHAIAE